MSFKELVSSIDSSEAFTQFFKANPEAELVAGFFILDFISNDNKESLDYLVQNTDRIYTFELNKNNEIVMKQDKLINEPNYPKLRKIGKKINIEVEELRAIAEEQAIKNKIFSKFHKIIAVLQIYDNRQIWNLTCILDGLIILNILIDCDTGEIAKFERKNMMDFIRRV